MVTLVKHEWHQVDSQFAVEIDDVILSEIYPDLDDTEIADKLRQIEEGDISVDEIIEDADNEGVDIEWDRQYDDWWTERKGGYDVTYELGDESSWHTPDAPLLATHKCSKCRWTGQGYESGTVHLREDGTVIEDYYNTDEESVDTKDVCPMCDSELQLTEHGVVEEEAKNRRMAEIDAMFADEDEE